MGAVAVLGILYTVLATVAIQAFRAEGESRRRMEASLLVGERLAALEAAGAAPPAGEEIEEVEIFSVETRVRALEAGSLGFGNDPENEEAALLLFASRDGSDAAPLREIEILVRWPEGDRDMEVRRITYAFDRSSLGGMFGEDGTGSSEGESFGDGDRRPGNRGSSGGGNRGGRGTGRRGGTPAVTPRVDCNSPCPAKDVGCLMLQLSQCT